MLRRLGTGRQAIGVNNKRTDIRLQSGRNGPGVFTFSAEAEFALPRWLDRILELVLDTERILIDLGVSLLFGGSRVVVAMRD